MWSVIIELTFAMCLGLIFYTYIGYPLFAALIGGRTQVLPQEKLPGISVLVPAFNEADVIEAKIDNFISLDYPSDLIEMIIVDDGSTDDTRTIIERKLKPNIRLLPPAERAGKAAGLNRMVDVAKHPFLLLCDANVSFDKNVARLLAGHMQRPEVGAVTGEVQLIGTTKEFESGESLYYIIERRIQAAESRMGSVMGVDGGMYLLRKNLFQSLPPDTILDDFAISLQVMRSGHRIIYDSDIKAKESGTPSSKQEFQRRVRMMAGVVQLLRRGNVPRLSQPILWFQFISHKLLRWITPLLVMALLFTTALLALGSSAYGFLFALQICVYAFFMLTVMVVPVRNHRLGSIVFYFFMSQVAIVIGIWKGVRNRQRVLWDKGRRASATVSA